MQGTRGGLARECWDRVVASDPGLVRARMAGSAAVAMAVALIVEYGYAKALGQAFAGTLVAMLLGGIVAMMGSMALTAPEPWPKVRTAVFFPVALGAGMLPGVAVAGHTDAMLAVFVAVMFIAVWVRRFGPAFFFYGFMFWMGYFFVAFLGSDLAEVPTLLGDVAIGTALILLLSLTLLRTRPRRTLRRVRRAFDARVGAVARACADLLEAHGDSARTQRAARRLHAKSLRLTEAALVIEAWSVEPGALPEGWSGSALRRRLLDAQLAIDTLAAAAAALAGLGGDLLLPAARICGHLARHEYPAVLYAARPLLAAPEDADPAAQAARRLARTATDLAAPAAGADVPADTGAAADYVPAATLAMGMLPGSAAAVGGLPARGQWNPLYRTSLTTRQAVQVAVAGALAIVLGRELSETRYYWAVIATFITFTGTATRSESSLKAASRVLGTLLGLGVGIGLAELTAGHTLWGIVTIVASMTCGFYVVNIAYTGMVFFITIMVAQLYSVLHEFTPGLLVLRLEETALGGAIGIAVGLLVLPLSTREAVQAVRRDFLAALAALLTATADRLEDGRSAPDPAALTRTLENHMRHLALVARPLTRPLISGGDRRRVRHQLTAYAAAARHGRALAAAPGRISGPAEAADLARACRSLADTAANLATAYPPDTPVPPSPPLAPPASAAADVQALLAVLADLSATETWHHPAEPDRLGVRDDAATPTVAGP